ncbi:MAG: phosphoadenylyl-sulfate reductase [Planctomycetota bacterium]|nr:MAG: phosphoadenylyl-sulfate reductase [Planctomycetota bacterium]
MANVPGNRLSKEEVASANATLEKASPQEVLRWALSTFGNSIALAWSGAEDIAVLDMMHRIDPKAARAFVLDTGRLNPETYELIDEVQAKYKMRIEILSPDAAAVEKMVAEKGINLFYRSLENRKECCGVRKVEPLNRILKTLDGWITGLRRTQAVTRGKLSKVEIDFQHDKIVKVNPLADWTTAQVFEYLQANRVPTNKLHSMGYPSIGCAPCTRAVKAGEDERAGRWWWENPESKECGLHPTP